MGEYSGGCKVLVFLIMSIFPGPRDPGDWSFFGKGGVKCRAGGFALALKALQMPRAVVFLSMMDRGRSSDPSPDCERSAEESLVDPPNAFILDGLLRESRICWWSLRPDGQLCFATGAGAWFPGKRLPRHLESWVEMVCKEDRSQLREAFARLRQGGEAFTLVVELQEKRGAEPVFHRLQGKSWVTNGERECVGLLEDVTALRCRDRQIGELLQAERDFAARSEGVFFRLAHDPKGSPVTYFLSERAELLTGVPYEELLDDWHRLETVVHPEDLARLKQASVGDQSVVGPGTQIRLRAGEDWTRVHLEYRHWIDALGCPRWDGVATEVREDWARLPSGRENGVDWEPLERAAGMVFYVRDTVGGHRLIRVSDSVENLLGYTVSDFQLMTGDGLRELCHPEDVPALREHWQTLSGLADGVSARCEFRMRNLDGLWVWLRCTETPSKRNEEGEVIQLIGMAEDITEKRRSESWRERRSALDVAGKVAGGVAHDLNNLLTILTANVSLIQEPDLSEEERRKCFEQIEATTQTAGELTHQLLTFAATEQRTRDLLDFSELVREVAELTVRGTNVVCRLEMEARDFGVTGEESALRHMLHHLVLNAVQAMPNGGCVTCRLRLADPEMPLPGELSPGKYLSLEVHDEGPGIAVHLKERVFEPFFTTKEDQNGLGLALSQHVVTGHGGVIEVEPGDHGLIRVHLPAEEALPQSEAAAPRASDVWEGSPPRILMLDDDPNVMTPYARMLGLQGFEVQTTITGDECIAAYQAAIDRGEPFDVVVLDLTLPGSAGGVEVLAELRKLNPEIVAIAHSGYSEDNALQHPKQYGFCAGLPKPAPIARMVAMLWELAAMARNP